MDLTKRGRKEREREREREKLKRWREGTAILIRTLSDLNMSAKREMVKNRRKRKYFGISNTTF